MINTYTASLRAGVTARQVDWWVRAGVIVPSAYATLHNGPARRWSGADVERLRTVGLIMAMGGGIGTAKLVMRHWRRGPGWIVVAPATGKALLVTNAEKVPKALRMVGGRALVVPLPVPAANAPAA